MLHSLSVIHLLFVIPRRGPTEPGPAWRTTRACAEEKYSPCLEELIRTEQSHCTVP